MSIHIGAKPGQIAEAVLLPGDPLRAQFVAEKYLEKAECHSRVRGMLGFTGLYKGRRVSVQGTGMGVPSISIYTQELIADYGCEKLTKFWAFAPEATATLEGIRVGLQGPVKVSIASLRAQRSNLFVAQLGRLLRRIPAPPPHCVQAGAGMLLAMTPKRTLTGPWLVS